MMNIDYTVCKRDNGNVQKRKKSAGQHSEKSNRGEKFALEASKSGTAHEIKS